jgi:phosphoribosylformylglycinamidine synthase PurS subunit
MSRSDWNQALTAPEPAGSTAVARVAVDVVIKPEILDPQGKAILAALARTGHPGVSSVRQGKHFDLEVDDSVTDEDLEQIAGTLLANPVIESWTVTRLGRAGHHQEAALAAPEAAL